jgi:transcriptional regulator with AAA-type ATPase domain
MDNLNVILLADQQDSPVIEATNLRLDIDFNSGIVNISGQQKFTLKDDSVHTSSLPPIGVRLADIPNMLTGMSTEQQANYNARKTVAETLLATITPAVTTALKSLYSLQNGGLA